MWEDTRGSGSVPAKRILVLGDSITHFGDYLTVTEFYFARFLPEYEVDILNLGVPSETVSGLSEREHPFPRPCVLGRAKRALEQYKPELVITCYGINDGIYEPFSASNFLAYQRGYADLIRVVKEAGARLVIMTPPVFDGKSFADELYEGGRDGAYSYLHPYQKYDEVMESYADYVMNRLAGEAECVIDLYHPMKEEIARLRTADPEFLHGDGIHPGLEGHIAMGQALLSGLFHRELPHLAEWVEAEKELFHILKEKRDLIHNQWTEAVSHDNPNKLEVLSAPVYEARLAELSRKKEEYLLANKSPKSLKGRWNGFRKQIIMFEGYEAVIVEPEKRRSDGAWIWRTEFFDAFAAADLEMVSRGFVLVHLTISNQYGGSEATACMERFGTFIVKQYSLSERCTLFGFSRGALYAVSYALACPEKVASIYLDAPVIDIRSWPAGYGEGVGAPKEWKECREYYGLTGKEREPESEQLRDWAKTRIERLAEKRIPLVMVAGDADDVVPYEENGSRLVKEYGRYGDIPLLEIIKPGVGHHPHSLEDPTPIADFIEAVHNKEIGK